jgi:hypothetical protein
MIGGRAMDRYGFYSFESFIVPPTVYRLDTRPESASFCAAEDSVRFK